MITVSWPYDIPLVEEEITVKCQKKIGQNDLLIYLSQDLVTL